MAGFHQKNAMVQSSARSWVERLEVTDTSGAFVGAPGFPRGFCESTPILDSTSGLIPMQRLEWTDSRTAT